MSGAAGSGRVSPCRRHIEHHGAHVGHFRDGAQLVHQRGFEGIAPGLRWREPANAVGIDIARDANGCSWVCCFDDMQRRERDFGGASRRRCAGDGGGRIEQAATQRRGLGPRRSCHRWRRSGLRGLIGSLPLPELSPPRPNSACSEGIDRQRHAAAACACIESLGVRRGAGEERIGQTLPSHRHRDRRLHPRLSRSRRLSRP